MKKNKKNHQHHKRSLHLSRTTMPKRGRTAAKDSKATSKRFRTAIEKQRDEILCPITKMLPLDPVMAEDGNVYDRSAIKKWFKEKKTSPVTNLKIRTKLIPAKHVTNMIQAMVDSGALSGDMVTQWKRWQEASPEQREVIKLREIAEAGNVKAAEALCRRYHYGKKVLIKIIKNHFDLQSRLQKEEVNTQCLEWDFCIKED